MFKFLLISIFLFIFKIQRHLVASIWQIHLILKQNRWCAWSLNLGPHDGRHRQIHGGPQEINRLNAKERWTIKFIFQSKIKQMGSIWWGGGGGHWCLLSKGKIRQQVQCDHIWGNFATLGYLLKSWVIFSDGLFSNS